MDELLKALRAFLSKAYKMTDGEIDALLSASDATEETILTGLTEVDRKRVASLTKQKPGQSFQDGYKKAKAEVLTDFEKEIREKYGIDDEELQGVELVAKVIETEAAQAGKEAKVTDDLVKKHPLYIQLEKASKKALTDKETEWKGKLDQKEKEFTKAKVFSSVSKQALDILMGLNPVLSQNPKVAQNQQRQFLRDLEGFTFEEQTDGSFIILDAEGKRVEDGHGNLKTLEDLIKERSAEQFDFKANNGGGNPGGDDDKKDKKDDKGGPKKYPAGVTKPKSIDDLSKLLNDPKIKPEDRQTIMETWEADNPNA